MWKVFRRVCTFIAAVFITATEGQSTDTNIRLFQSFNNQLQNGSPSGIVQVFHNGRWGTICDDNFGQQEADVACRQLGYTHAITFGAAVDFGYRRLPQRIPIWLDDVSCDDRNSDTLQTCEHNQFGDHNCVHEEDVAVVCNMNPPQTRSQCQSCAINSIRLVTEPSRADGGVVTAGRVEVFINGRWGTVCDDHFGRIEADVACRQLGFAVAIDFGRADILGFPIADRSVPILLDEVHCSMTHTSLQNCSHEGIEIHNCIHNEDIAVICNSDTFTMLDDLDSNSDSSAHTAGETAAFIVAATVVGITVLCILPVAVLTTCCCLYYFYAYRPSTRNVPVRVRRNRVAQNPSGLSRTPALQLDGNNNHGIEEQTSANHQIYTTQNVYPQPAQTIESTHFTSTHTKHVINLVPVTPAPQAAYPMAPPAFQSQPPYVYSSNH